MESAKLALEVMVEVYGFDAVQRMLDELAAKLRCAFCEQVAEWRGWYRVGGPMGFPSGLIRRVQVCENHKHFLIGVQAEETSREDMQDTEDLTTWPL